jgi:hypothetical protein
MRNVPNPQVEALSSATENGDVQDSSLRSATPQQNSQKPTELSDAILVGGDCHMKWRTMADRHLDGKKSDESREGDTPEAN